MQSQSQVKPKVNATFNTSKLSNAFQKKLNQDGIQYSIYKSLNYKSQLTDIPNKKILSIFDEIIEQIQESHKMGQSLSENGVVGGMLTENIKTIIKYCEQGYAKAGLLACITYIFINQNTGNFMFAFNTSFQAAAKLLKNYSYKKYHQKIMEKGVYPLYLAYVAQQASKQGDHQANQMIETAIQYGEPYAFIVAAQIMFKNGDAMGSYIMYKNAEFYGYSILAHEKLRDLFCVGGSNLGKSLPLAEKYHQLFGSQNRIGFMMTPMNLANLRQQNKIKKSQQIKISLYQLFEAQIVSNFLANKQAPPPPIDMNNNFKMISFQNLQFKTVSKITNLGFLGKLDNDNNVYLVSLKELNDTIKIPDLNPQNDLPLGTKIILQKCTKINERRFLIEMDSEETRINIKLSENKQQEGITNQMLRKYARILFQHYRYNQALQIYDHLVKIQAPQLQIIHSNRGLVYEKLSQTQQAIKCYKMSLNYKKYDKSQWRLAYALLKINRVQQVKQLLTTMKNSKEKNQIEAQYLKILQKQKRQ